MVVKTSKPLIDWPRSDMLDINGTSSRYCDEICVEMNAHAVLALQQAGAIAGRVGMNATAQHYAERAEVIRKAARATFASTSCTPAAPACYLDQPRGKVKTTTAPATVMAAAARLPRTAEDTLKLVSFLRSRNARRGAGHGLEVSGWLAGFMLRGLYVAAGETDEGPIPLPLALDAVDYSFSVLTANGTNSWLNMIRQGATMTMEAWSQDQGIAEGGGTYSHPWTAAPAAIIPRYLAGVRPISDAWRRVAVSPLPPGHGLSQFAIDVPTLRGVIALAAAWDFTAKSFSLALTVPGNTEARVCLPRYLFPVGANCSATLNDAPVAAKDAGALLCLNDDVGAGRHSVTMRCR